MTVQFGERTYSSKSIRDLSHSNKDYEGLVDFMLDWHNGAENFHFLTSGSTGSAKRITVNRNQIQASIDATQKKLCLSKHHTVLLCLNPNFVASKMMVARAISIGMNLVIAPASASPLQPIRTKIDFVSLVPFQIYKMIADGSVSQLEKIKTVLIGGAPLEQWAIDYLSKFKNDIYLTYGMTETVSHIALQKITDLDSNGLYSILDGIAIQMDHRSCLCIMGAVTNHKLISTNDMVSLKSGNTFEWLGRYDNIINSGGIKINPEKLERLIASEFSDKNFFVAGIPNKELGQKCILVIEGNMNKDEFASMQNYLSKTLTRHYIPKEVFNLDSFIYTDSKKLMRVDTLKLIKP